MSQPEHPDPDERKLTPAEEGDIDDDRQDPPISPKTGGDDDLDGFKATPGDDPADD